MARKKIFEEPEVPRSVDPKVGISLLKRQIEKANSLLSNRPIVNSDHTAWENTTRDYLIKSFGSKSQNVDAVIYASSSMTSYVGMSDEELEEYKASQLQNQIKMLESCIEQLETEISLKGEKSTAIDEVPKTKIGRDVFIVHGINHEIKETVARIVDRLGLTPIILHEQPNMGRTLIEKFTDYANVEYAIVILTADDLGRDKDKDQLSPRARQNVIFELGYFLGKLGRIRVCALYENSVEIPSDYTGVVYVELDSAGKWKFDLVKELKAAGYCVDANKLF